MQDKKILIIGDDVHTNQLIETTFVEEGAEVETAVTGQEGLRQFHAHPPDLVVIDLMLPEMDGWEVTESILETADVPIIMLTSLRDDADAIEGLERGVIDFVLKPFSPKVLAARARAALRQT